MKLVSHLERLDITLPRQCVCGRQLLLRIEAFNLLSVNSKQIETRNEIHEKLQLRARLVSSITPHDRHTSIKRIS